MTSTSQLGNRPKISIPATHPYRAIRIGVEVGIGLSPASFPQKIGANYAKVIVERDNDACDRDRDQPIVRRFCRAPRERGLE